MVLLSRVKWQIKYEQVRPITFYFPVTVTNTAMTGGTHKTYYFVKNLPTAAFLLPNPFASHK